MKKWICLVLVVLLAFLFFVAIPMFLYTAFRYETVGPAISTEAVEQNTVVSLARPTAEEVGEFALIWEGDIGFEYLAIGQDSMPEKTFPFGTTLRPTALEQVLDTDFAVMKLHRVTCGALDLEYLRISEEDTRDSLSRVSTISGGYETPRGIGVGSEETELLGWYGDELSYLMITNMSTLRKAPAEWQWFFTCKAAMWRESPSMPEMTEAARRIGSTINLFSR